MSGAARSACRVDLRARRRSGDQADEAHLPTVQPRPQVAPCFRARYGHQGRAQGAGGPRAVAARFCAPDAPRRRGRPAYRWRRGRRTITILSRRADFLRAAKSFRAQAAAFGVQGGSGAPRKRRKASGSGSPVRRRSATPWRGTRQAAPARRSRAALPGTGREVGTMS